MADSAAVFCQSFKQIRTCVQECSCNINKTLGMNKKLKKHFRIQGEIHKDAYIQYIIFYAVCVIYICNNNNNNNICTPFLYIPRFVYPILYNP